MSHYPDPPLAPLTKAEFDDGCGYTFRDVPICEDEDGRYVYAFGHVDKELMVGAVLDFDREVGDPTAEPHETADVEHTYAVTVLPADHPDGWWVGWYDVAADTPGAFPLTVVTR